MKEIIISANDASQRLDRFLKKYLSAAPLSAIYKAIRKDVKVNGRRSKEDYMLQEGDSLCFYLPDELLESYVRKPKQAKAKKQFTIAYEDDNILVVSKPFGLLVHGDVTEKKNTLANQVVDYLIESGAYVPRLEKSFTPSPANRLDRNTTGLVLFGKNAPALRALTAMVADKEGSLEKYYLTICEGKLTEERTLGGYMLKDEATNRVRMVRRPVPGAKEVKTVVTPLFSTARYTLVQCRLLTGRSHQIRLHLADIGHPIYGDPKYGKGSGQLLHAYKLVFGDCPEGFRYLNGTVVTSPLPPEFRRVADKIFERDTEELI